MEWSSPRVAEILKTSIGKRQVFSSISTDTRSLRAEALFVALVGEHFDGHDFLEEARRRGATGAVVRKGTRTVDGLTFFEVDDTLVALGVLARARRGEVTGPVVAVTGTNGKTSTKEMLGCVLGTRWRVQTTRENQNNLVGVPLTILAAPADCEALVVEAGANLPGELRRLRKIIEPTVGVVTNVSAGHLEGFGSLESTLAEKVSLLDQVPTAVVGTKPPELAGRAQAVAGRVIVAGLEAPADVRPDRWSVKANGHAELVVRGIEVTLPLVGVHQADNAMVALAVAIELAVDLEAARDALETVALPPGRCEVIERRGLTVVHDAYNANPGSLSASLATVAAMCENRPLVVILGTMLELGKESDRLHREMADKVVAMQPALVAAVGAFVPALERHAASLGDRLVLGEDPGAVGKLVAARLAGNELILLKGSRGVHMERALPHLLPDDQHSCSTTS